MMKKNITICIILLFSFLNCKAESFTNSVYSLIERITPGYSKYFELELIESDNGDDVYEIKSRNNKILLRGNNAISLATAFNQYLKYSCNVHVSWFGDQLKLPKRLPLPQKEVRNIINGKYRVYMNYCTVSYSAAWWDWKRWEREIDYMAMNSINMPLSVVGLEAVWYNTLLKHNFTDKEIRSFLTGPAHFAWQWMQNIQSYGGPLPKSWIDKHIVLGKQIIERELDFGMKPIQQGFSGYVPRELKDKYPKARIELQPSWCGFIGAAQIDPTDSLFNVLGRDFLEEEKKLYGTYGFYAADPFHESNPPINTPEYLKAVGQSIHKLFNEFDSNSIWLMQAWSLREDIVKAVPKDQLIILDLNGEKSKQNNACWGYPIIVGNLHNFGGRINLHGDLRLISSNQYETALKKSPNVCGSGMFMEAIEQNPVYYDLVFEMPLHHDSINIEEWLSLYSQRRYGSKSVNAIEAWKCLLEGPYSSGTNGTENSSIITARPAINVKKSGPNAGFNIPYSPLLLLKAQTLLLKDIEKHKKSSPYCFDIIDIQRQIMSNLGQEIHKKAMEAFKNKDKEAFILHKKRFLGMLEDVDKLLRTRSEFNFYKWIHDARRWGENDAEMDILEKDATSLVTIWGGDADPIIFDYSWREWCGLIKDYYSKRWSLFYDHIQYCMENGIEYNEKGLLLVHGREAFRANELYNKMADEEMNFVCRSNKDQYPLIYGNEIKIIKEMYKKYYKLSQIYYNTNNEFKKETYIKMKYIENFGEK